MNRVFENTVVLFIAHLIARFLSLGLIILLMPRYFSEEDFGNYLLAMFITNLIASVAELGMQAPLIREMTLHRRDTRHFVGNALIIRILLSIVAFSGMIGSGYLFGYPRITLQMIYLLGLAEAINSIAQLFRCVFRAFEQMKYEAFTLIAERASVACVGGALILLGIDIVDFCIIVLTASVLNLILSIGIVARRFTPLRFKFDLEIWGILMRQAIPFALGNIFNMIYFRIDAVMLSKLGPDGVAANAWYGLAYMIVNAFTILPGAFMGAMFPMMTRAFVDETVDFRLIYTNAIRWMFVLGMPFAVGMAVLAERIVLFLPPDYNRLTIAPALHLLSWAGGLTFLTTVMITVLRAADKRRAFTLLMGTTALLNIVLNFFLIPGIKIPWTNIRVASHVGAAVTMIISESYLFIAGFIYISRRISKLTRIGFAIKAMVVSALMGTGLIYLRDIMAIWLLIPAAIAFYCITMTILGEMRSMSAQR